MREKDESDKFQAAFPRKTQRRQEQGGLMSGFTALLWMLRGDVRQQTQAPTQPWVAVTRRGVSII